MANITSHIHDYATKGYIIAYTTRLKKHLQLGPNNAANVAIMGKFESLSI